MKELMDILKNPPKEYRPVPFWSWNDKLDPEMLKWQIREMDKAGLGGYFMHARGGLQTDYMSKEWMDCIKTCIDEGNKHGMNSWCYDEEGWPSGFAGGIVTAVGEKYHMRWIDLEVAGQADNISGDDLLGVYGIGLENNKLHRICLKELQNEWGNYKKLIIIRQKSNPYYIDILNKDVVKAFIEVTHEKYYEFFKEEFGKGMPGFFTDEPQFAREYIPWSNILMEVFDDRYGYNVLDWLPALFIECEGYEKFRYDYWNLINELYVKSFGEQIYNWCEEHNCKLTGHSIQEDSFLWQMYCSAGVMPFYEYMHIPGIDWLTRRIDSPIIPKQVSSVANQLGKKFVLSETFALCGWDVSFEELKWIAEWQYVNGINLMCQHLEGYTLRGFRKRDYPPSLFYQQSWWEEYRLFNDYFARLGVLMTSGRNVADVLLLHPMKSVWVTYNFGNNETLEKLNSDFTHATEELSGLHIDHHYGDETIIGKYGRIEGDKFIVGQCKYRVVIIPSMISLDEKTLELLVQFVAVGGKIISMGKFPTLCEGVKDKRIGLLKNSVNHTHEDREALYILLKEMLIPAISIADGNGENTSIHYQQRCLGNSQVFFMVNHDKEHTFNSEITFKGKGKLIKYIAENSEIEEVNYKHEGDSTKLKLRFLPMQSHIIIFNDEDIAAKSDEESNKIYLKPDEQWNVEEMDLNSLTLDYCYYSIDNGEWTGPIHTINLMDILLNRKSNCDIALKFNFETNLDLNKNKEMLLAVEKADEFEVLVNGENIEYKDMGWWKDSTFKVVDIKPLVRNGTNEVILRRKFYQSQHVYDVLFGENILETERNKLTYDVELESIYVVGDFGVVSKSGCSYGERKAVFTDGPFVIVNRPDKVETGDLTEQGFCFFAGSIKLSQDIRIIKENNSKIYFDLGKSNAVISKVYLNDRLVKVIPWAPYDIEVTDFVRDGSNKLTVQLFAGNRNLLGPHHNAGGELYAVGPSSFTDRPGWESDNNTDQWRDGYCFVEFGLDSAGEP